MIGDVEHVALGGELHHLRHRHGAHLEGAGLAGRLREPNDGPIARCVDGRMHVKARRAGDDVRVGRAVAAPAIFTLSRGAVQLEGEVREPQRLLVLVR